MREGARGGKRVRASILQCVFGAPVSGGGNALRRAVAGSVHFTLTGPFGWQGYSSNRARSRWTEQATKED
jgi:hypothetical protein